jgi:hypothetical protein
MEYVKMEFVYVIKDTRETFVKFYNVLIVVIIMVHVLKDIVFAKRDGKVKHVMKDMYTMEKFKKLG